MEVKTLFFWLLLLGCPGHQNVDIIHVLSGFLHLEPDVYGILQKFTDSIAVLPDFFHLGPDVYGILHQFTGITDILPDFFHLGPDVYGILHKFTAVIDILPDFLHLGPDVYGIPWKFTGIAASLGISAILIFSWRIVCAALLKYPVKPPKNQVNVQQIPEKTDNIKEKITEHSENMSISKQKTAESKKHGQKTTRHNKMLSDEALKGNIKTIEKADKHSNGVPESTPATPPSVRGQNVKNPKASQDANAEFEDSELSTSLKRLNLEDKKKKLKDSCEALRAEKVMKEAELKMLKENIDNLVGVYEQRKMAAEEKLKIKKHNLMEKESELSAMKENLKSVSEETLKYKQQQDQIQEQLQRAENVYRFQICVCEKKAQDNWIKSRILERELEKQRREAAYWKYRLEMMERKKQEERYWMNRLMQGRPELQNHPQRGSGPGAAPGRNGSSFPPEEAKEAQVNMDARGPPRFRGPPGMPDYMGGPSPFVGYGPSPPGSH
ncbi:uncharacterized protein [Vicugna pacos]|uniref:Uncharacterized protein isoform X2 n=1 Tax=Vicugna pacos TaxID=30538 RepID=A0ABM5BP78_VICPA